MKTQTLSLTCQNLNTNEIESIALFASNPFMLMQKMNNFYTKNNYITGWNLTNNKWEAGNNGLNAGAYLYETLEELQSLY